MRCCLLKPEHIILFLLFVREMHISILFCQQYPAKTELILLDNDVHSVRFVMLRINFYPPQVPFCAVRTVLMSVVVIVFRKLLPLCLKLHHDPAWCNKRVLLIGSLISC